MKRMDSGLFYFIFALHVLLIFPANILAQDLALSDESTAPDAFRNSVLINAQTTTMAVPHSFEFSIRHRFGTVGFDRKSIKYFFGLDLAANIRFGFVVPVTAKMYIGAGRTKNGKTYDLEAKHLLLSQASDNKIPFSLAVYADVAANSEDLLEMPSNAFFADGVTPFRNKFNHRLAYNSQLIISRKFGDKLSFLLTPTLIYRNLVEAGEENQTFVLPLSGAFKTGLNSSILFEYAFRFNNRPVDKLYPLSVAMEFGTVGHVFQLVVGSSQEILEQQLYTSAVSDYTKGKISLGFNIKRTFWNKNKKIMKGDGS